jgi:hypothetical protein
MKRALPATSIPTGFTLVFSIGSREVDLEKKILTCPLLEAELSVTILAYVIFTLRRQPEHPYVCEKSGMEPIKYGFAQIYSDSHR